MSHTCRSMAELQAALEAELRSAMEEAEAKAVHDVTEGNTKFYDSPKPKIYQRTGQLQRALWDPGITGSGLSLQMEIGRDGRYEYATGSHPSGWTVFSWAEVGAAGLVGQTGTWAETEENIKKDVDNVFRSHFN